MNDAVKHPGHYTSHPSGVECIEIVKHMTFCAGSAVKYIWRAGLKGDAVQDLRKAIQQLEFEIARIEAERAKKAEDDREDAAACEVEWMRMEPQAKRRRALMDADFRSYSSGDTPHEFELNLARKSWMKDEPIDVCAARGGYRKHWHSMSMEEFLRTCGCVETNEA